MDLLVRPYRDADHDALLALLRSPEARGYYEIYDAPDGVQRLVEGTYTPRAGVHVAYAGAPEAGGELAGFGCAIILPGPPQALAALRGVVRERFRRRGIGRALYQAVHAYTLAQRTSPAALDLMLSSWEPLAPLQGFAESLGYRHARWMWMMERPRGGVAEPAWPAGVTVRTLDGSDAALHDWNDAYNLSFAGSWGYVVSPIENVRELAGKPDFRSDAILLAHRDGDVAGFCRLELYENRGEIGTLGTTPAARGIGLGRALLRWGIAWLERETTLPVTIVVDGENETALRLYHAEGVEVTRRRGTWVLPVAAPAGAGAPA